MLKTCPRCGDFFAHEAPPFCPSDGTPLADVETHGDGWEQGARVVEEKTRLVQRRVRRLRLRRVLTKTMTLVVVTLVVFVVVANYVIYLKPDTEAPRLLAAVLPSPTPTSPTPVPIPTPSPTITPSPTPTPTPKPVCTDEDRRAAEKLILSKKNRGRWDDDIANDRDERDKILAQYAPFEGMAHSGTPTYGVTFTKDCQTATVTAHYTWRVTSAANIMRKERSREVELKWMEVKAKRTFRCSKDGGAWRCP